MQNPVVSLARSQNEKDTLYYHEAIQKKDSRNFIEAIVKEMNPHIQKNHWSLIDKSDAPEGHKIIPAVWSMKRKREISTRSIIKYKARLNVHGG